MAVPDRPAAERLLGLPDTSPEENADVAGWLNGIVFNPLKWRSVIGNLGLASWSMNLVAWSLYVEICAAPAVSFVESHLPSLFYWLKKQAIVHLMQRKASWSRPRTD